MSALKRLGVIDALYCQPLYRRLVNDDGFSQVVDVPAAHAINLRDHTLDAAFLTPIDYARDADLYRIVPGVGVASSHPTGSINLFFRDALHSVSTVAVDPSSSSEIVLARILLAEQFDLTPSFVPVFGSFEDRMRKADAVLLSADASLRKVDQHPNNLDLVELWNDLTDLPYVHGIWCMHDGDLSATEVRTLQTVAHRGISSLADLADELNGSGTLPFPSAKSFRAYWDAFSFSLSEDDIQGLGEFLRYAFYHGVLPEVAELNFCPQGDAPAPADVSPN